MKTQLIRILALSISLFVSLPSMAQTTQCISPSAPTVPDGSVATKEEMLAGKEDIGTYQAELLDYRNCLEQKIANLQESEAEQKAYLGELYDVSVEVETAVSISFNHSIKVFNKKNK